MRQIVNKLPPFMLHIEGNLWKTIPQLATNKLSKISITNLSNFSFQKEKKTCQTVRIYLATFSGKKVVNFHRPREQF
jgi:hypothetical protein